MSTSLHNCRIADTRQGHRQHGSAMERRINVTVFVCPIAGDVLLQLYMWCSTGAAWHGSNRHYSTIHLLHCLHAAKTSRDGQLRHLPTLTVLLVLRASTHPCLNSPHLSWARTSCHGGAFWRRQFLQASSPYCATLHALLCLAAFVLHVASTRAPLWIWHPTGQSFGNVPVTDSWSARAIDLNSKATMRHHVGDLTAVYHNNPTCHIRAFKHVSHTCTRRIFHQHMRLNSGLCTSYDIQSSRAVERSAKTCFTPWISAQYSSPYKVLRK